MNIPTISLAQFAGFLKKYLKSGDKLRPVAGWGPVGAGKSSVIRQVAEDLEIGFIDVRASQLEPVDVRGIQTIEDGLTKCALPDWLPNVERDGERVDTPLRTYSQARTQAHRIAERSDDWYGINVESF